MIDAGERSKTEKRADGLSFAHPEDPAESHIFDFQQI